MSSTEFHTGKLKEIDMGPYENENLAEQAKFLINKGFINCDFDEECDYFECSNIARIGNTFYEIIDHYSASDEDQDIGQANKNEDGTISFMLQFYNGGCGFDEALEDTLQTINKK